MIPAGHTAFSHDDHRSPWVLIFVVTLGLGVSAVEVGFEPPFLAKILPIGGVYLALMVWFGDRMTPRSPALFRWGYFTLQMIVMCLVAYVFLQHRIFGVEWLLFMPLIAQSRILLSSFGSLVISVLSLAIIAVHIGFLAGWEDVPSAVFGISTAVVFVILFTDIAMRESSARLVSQRLSEELEAANRRLSEYAVQAEELAGARERTRMAREIHDSLGHSLTAVHMQIEAARTILDHDRDKAAQALEKAQGCIKEGLGEIRASVSSLRSDPLEGRSLPQALNDLTRVSTDSGLSAHLKIRGNERPLTAPVTLTLFRCAQEALTNARKHAQASAVQLMLDFGLHHTDGVRLTVTDDGVGCDPDTIDPSRDNESGAGFGLVGLRERVRQQNGELRLSSAQGEGLTLETHVPSPLPADLGPSHQTVPGGQE